MPRLPIIGVGLAGFAVFVLALLALVQGENMTLTQPETTAADEGGTTDGAQGTPEDPANVVRVHPEKVVIEGEKWGLRNVAYSRVPLTAWISDLSTDGATTNGQNTNGQGGAPQESPDLSWSPVSAGDGSVPLTVAPSESDEDMTGPCAKGRSLPEGSNSPSCYNVGLEGSSRLPAGTYGATIYVGDAPDSRRAIPVEVLVGRPLYWLILVVAAGVLATELVVWWREGGAHRRGWRVRRAKWLDWLSEDLGWTRPYKGDDVERGALRMVQKSLREKVVGLREWLDRGTKGETVISELPGTEDAAEDMVYPLRSECERYLDNPDTLWRGTLDHLEESLAELGRRAVSAVREDLNKAYECLAQVHWDKNSVVAKAYNELDEKWRTAPKPTDKKLSDAWSAIQALWSRAEELKKEAPKQPVLSADATTPTDVANAANALSGHLGKLRADVFSKASESLKSLEGMGPQEPGRQQTEAFLTKVVKWVPYLEQAEQRVDRAKHPLKFAGDNRSVGETLESLRRDLQTLDEAIGGTFSKDLTEDAVRVAILKPVREQLESTEAVFYDRSQAAKERWFELRSKYNQYHHFVRLGERIFENKKLIEEDLRPRWNVAADDGERQSEVQRCLKEAERHLKRAYRFLLAGKALDGEIELERAEESVQRAYRERAKHTSLKVRILTTITEDLVYPAKQLAQRFLRILTSTMFAILMATTIALTFLLWLLHRLTFSGGDGDTASIPGWFPLDELLARGLEKARFILVHPLWFGFLFAILISIGLVFLQYRTLTKPARDVGARERWENAWPFAVRVVLGIVSGLLSLVIAVTVILAYQQTVPEEQMATWGTNLDLVIAFALGVLAHGIVQSLRSASEDLMSFLRGEKPSTAEGEESKMEGSGATEGGATVAAKGGAPISS